MSITYMIRKKNKGKMEAIFQLPVSPLFIDIMRLWQVELPMTEDLDFEDKYKKNVKVGALRESLQVMLQTIDGKRDTLMAYSFQHNLAPWTCSGISMSIDGYACDFESGLGYCKMMRYSIVNGKRGAKVDEIDLRNVGFVKGDWNSRIKSITIVKKRPRKIEEIKLLKALQETLDKYDAKETVEVAYQ